MNCKQFQERLDDWLDGKLSADAHAAAERHRSGCVACCDLERVLREQIEIPPIEAPADLASSIFRRTSGGACDHAHALLCDHVDARLADLDRELLESHLQSCRACADLAGALARMAVELPAMAEMRPDAEFVRDVVAAVLRGSAGWVRRLRRAAAGWNAMLQRPRFALEAAYVFSVLLFVVAGAWPVRVYAAAENLEPELVAWVSPLIKRAEGATRERVGRASAELSLRAGRVQLAARDLNEELREMLNDPERRSP